jgi:1,4-dihydroxy-2-naphthoate octaprenyltransferase
MSAIEPTLDRLHNPFLRYFLATRPAFLSVTFIACLIGLATAYSAGLPINAPAALATVVFALVAHAGVNVLNDYYDALNGTDAANTDRLFPFTGGSRFIQNGVLSKGETAVFGFALFGAVMAAGLWLMQVSDPGLFWVGAAGLFIGWAYSAPPFKLNSRGVGELCVAAGFMLIAIGTDYVQRHGFAWEPVVASLPFALLVTNLLYINQFPDCKADGSAGKRTVIVRLGPARAARGYLLIGIAAYAWLVAAVTVGLLPWPALAALLPALFTLKAGRVLLRHAETPFHLLPGIQMTILAAISHGTLLAAGLAAAAWMAR